ncbi:hypothetical protein I6Y99_004932 [Vibrio parahaemolyticus]|uniref:hypothetical protein n=1 Tax=Vibrio TaxID=662 RepID=UPI0004717DE0|nr:hypothetical protein [Vibrio parahaemolyticus]EGQ7810864.1 hypothetical protein [Vibrio parahaemolyticus]MBE4804685.1 hypothetical protein [Vibrio parahaemolyticus]MDF4628346.1 hypothetical protein [Vibrio parahaemolyticus]MDF5187689.1 hypothetical protein [Vibrio parahaemolyticus]MDF5202502.1 hypothetical protein [Vibrio parahaemolyticus]
MNLEEEMSKLNEFYFFKEFTYSSTLFKREDGQEVELADNVLMIDDLYVIYQLKERFEPENSTAEKEIKWFEKKIIKNACSQIRDSLRYIGDYDEVHLENNRGHKINIATDQVKNIHKVVMYKPSKLLPTEVLQKKSHKSSTVGVIHLFCKDDYFGLIESLATPAELNEYLSYREQLILNFPEIVNELPEQALLGQYLVTDKIVTPNIEYALNLATLNLLDTEPWDMTGVISKFPDRMRDYENTTDYYFILTQLAKMTRGELKAFKDRFTLSFELANENRDTLPYRFSVPRLDCGFVFIPSKREDRKFKHNRLTNLTLAHKYEQKNTKCIGVIFINNHEKWCDVDWCYVDSKWEQNKEMEALLSEHYPFRPVTIKNLDRYVEKK